MVFCPVSTQAQWQNNGMNDQQLFQQLQQLQQLMHQQGGDNAMLDGFTMPLGGNTGDGFGGNGNIAQLLSQNDWRDNRDYYRGGNNTQRNSTRNSTGVFGGSCEDTCVSRGKLPEVCDKECGLVRDEGVFYNEGYDPAQLPPVMNQEQGAGFDGVNYDCFRQCRLKGDSFETCTILCGQ